MHVWALAFFTCFVASDSAHLAGDTRQFDVDEFHKIPIKRRLIPIVATNRFDDLRMGQRFVGLTQQS